MAFTLDAKITSRFFDRASVVTAITANERRALSRIGAFVRRRAITDVLRRTIPSGQRRRVGRDRGGRFMRTRQSAAPGRPPVIHSKNKTASLRNIGFGLDADSLSVVIGPVGLPSSRLKRSSAQTVPELMEFGGSATVTEHARGSEWHPGKSNAPGALNRERSARYEPHPFMGPALDKEVAAGNVLNAFATVRR